LKFNDEFWLGAVVLGVQVGMAILVAVAIGAILWFIDWLLT
jgi:hypothetical protein